MEKEITMARNGHVITLYQHNSYFYVTNVVHDQDGYEIDLAALHDYDGYPIERRFSSMANALHFMRKCVKNAY